jgi:transposase-like protein
MAFDDRNQAADPDSYHTLQAEQRSDFVAPALVKSYQWGGTGSTQDAMTMAVTDAVAARAAAVPSASESRQTPASGLRAGSTFSGVGGMDKGLHDAGLEHEFFAEWESWRRGILARHWPGVRQFDDVREVGVPASKLTEQQFQQAIREYVEDGRSIAEIADHLPITRQSLHERFRRAGVEMRAQQRHGADNHFYRGGPRGADWAHNKVEKAIARGELVRPATCEACAGPGTPYRDGRSPIQAHHDDYNKPLDVRWLCQPCHHEWHKNNEPIPLAGEVVKRELPGQIDLLVGGFP